MEDYRLEQSGQEVQDILNGAAMQVDLNSEVERATEAENILDGKIDAEEERAKVAEKANADDIDAIEEKIPSGASSSNKLATASDVNDEAQARSDADQTINGKIDTIEAKIPTGASSENKLATEEYVDDSVATNTATFRGTYNLVSDLGLLPSATHEQIAYALGGEIATVDNSDYCFVQIPTSSETPTQIAKIERYKFNGDSWAFEYDLNNSGFTAAQWAAINSGITSGDVTKLSALPTNAELTTLLNGKQDTLTFDNTPTENSNNPVKSGGVYSGIKAEEERAKAAEKANADDIDAIEEKIPSGASSSNKLATASDISGLDAAIEAILLLIPSAATSLNQLADKAFVNSSIATNTATFRGTFNSVSDLHLSISATHEQIGTMLASSIATADNNDYAFVQIPTSAHRPTEIARTERYKFNGTTWEYEYDLNNSGYTTAQWAAINSTITQELVTKLSALPNNDDLTTALSVLTDSISAINAKIPSAASSDNKLVDTTAMQTYIAQLLDVLDATYNVTSTDGHVTVQITQTNGKVTAFAVTTRDIASAADLELIAGRVTTAEGNISTNAEDIAQLQAAYAALTQNDLVIIQPTDTWPVANPAENIIYRVVDRVNTPPEYYSDYMWNGTTMVLMAQYNNAIDRRPKKGSTNLVESGGVFDNMGALDVSELNATENPHTLATYSDLSAAIAAIPSDYQKGGMSIKFVQSYDNNYVQYRFMLSSFTDAQFATVDYWQGVDNEVIDASNNLVKSSGVAHALDKKKLTGRGNTDIYAYFTGIIPNHKYVLYLKNKDYAYTVDTGGTRWRFRIIHKASGADVIDVTVPSTAPQNMQDSYIITPTNTWDNDSLRIGVRADAGVNVEFTLLDITILNLLEKDSTPVENSTKPVTSGGLYTKFSEVNESITALTNSISKIIYDVDVKHPLQEGYYTLETAIAAISSGDRKVGMIISFFEVVDSKIRKGFYIYITNALDHWLNTSYWSKILVEGEMLPETKYFSIDNSRITTYGSINSSEDFIRTDYLVIDNNRHIGGVLCFNQYCSSISFYDKEKNFISRYGSSLSGLVHFELTSSDIPDNAVYVIFTNYKGDSFVYGGIYYGVSVTENDLIYNSNSINPISCKVVYEWISQKRIPGRGNTNQSVYFKGLLKNHKYALFIGNPNWSYTVDTGGTRWKFRLYHKENGVDMYSDTVMSTNTTGMKSVYDVLPNSSWDTDTFYVGVRADSGVEVELSLIDVTAIETFAPQPVKTIFDLNSYKDSIIDNLGYYPTANSLYKSSDIIPPLCFLHASDVHNVEARYVNIVSVLNHYSFLKWGILTGDLVSEDFAQPFTPYANAVAAATKPLMFVLGNHDCGNPANLSVDRNGSNLQCYNKYFANYIDDWGVVHSGTNNYWYKDDATCKVRLIGLYEYDTDFELNSEDNTKILYNRSYRSYSQAQIDWFIGCLTSLPAGYGVIIAEHQPEGARQTGSNPFCSPIIATGWGWDAYYENRQTLPIARIVDAFINKTSLNATINQTGGIVTTLNLVADFTNRDDDQEFICYLGGHQHNDYIGFLSVYPQQLEVQVGCSKYDTSLQDMARKDNHTTQDCINLVSIDRNKKLINIVRFGADTSMTMQDRKCISIKYITD